MRILQARRGRAPDELNYPLFRGRGSHVALGAGSRTMSGSDARRVFLLSVGMSAEQLGLWSDVVH